MNFFNKTIVKLIPYVPKKVVRIFASKYIAGETLSDAIQVTAKLNEKGILATMDVLGEDISTKEEAERNRDECIEVIKAINKFDLDSNLSLKLTQLGLKINLDLCFQNLKSILEKAKLFNQFVRIDMEDSSCTDSTIQIFERARDYYPNCGIVLQAYLNRTLEDATRLIEKKANFRLCKGIYVEPETIAIKDKQGINRNFLKILKTMLATGCYVGIATHDEELVQGSYKLIEEFKLEKTSYEFQMLLGVRENLRASIVKNGHRLRVYVPFGKHWYKYSLRRFKENPQIAGYIFKSILFRD
ncbi:proline dehydrogenase family protein [bacterium]|nr:proline dehydrogenase family protein [bacterium]